MYWLIFCRKDGVVQVVPFAGNVSLAQLLEYHGLDGYKPFSHVPPGEDPKHWGSNYLVISGEQVTPKAVEVVTTVTKWELP